MTNYSPNVLITGGNGQLASCIAKHSSATDVNLIICNKTELDICQPASIQQAIDMHVPDIIINTAAYTAVDKAEEEVSLADRVNHIGAGQLALACQKNQIKLIHLSTDYIFDGDHDGKYLEEDQANPINIYGKSKWEGEQAIRNTCPNHVILRVSGVFSEYGQNFLKTMLKLAKERTSLRVVSDQVSCPTYAGDIAGALLTMCLAPSHKGTYHFCSNEAVSWYDFAKAIIQHAALHEKLAVSEAQKITTAEYPTAAKRPRHSVLNCDKITSTYQIIQPSWRDAITKVINKLILEKA